MEIGSETPPIVLDTNVLVAGACRHEGSRAYQILWGVLQKRVPLILTPSIALEYHDVLQRPAVAGLTGLSLAQSIDLVNELVYLSRQVQLRFQWRPNLRDESDNKFVEAAIHSGAIVVTYNKRDYGEADLGRHGWDIMSPDEFMLRFSTEETF